jgi:DNA-directed RNA polymerase specialized sigma54-like protein
MTMAAPHPSKDTLKYWLDKVKEEDDRVYTQIPLFAENNSEQARRIVSLIYDRIRELDIKPTADSGSIRLRYYYVLDAILKKQKGKFVSAFEDTVLPRFPEEMDKARSNPQLLKSLLELLTSWEGLLGMNHLNACLKKFYSIPPILVQ